MFYGVVGFLKEVHSRLLKYFTTIFSCSCKNIFIVIAEMNEKYIY